MIPDLDATTSDDGYLSLHVGHLISLFECPFGACWTVIVIKLMQFEVSLFANVAASRSTQI